MIPKRWFMLGLLAFVAASVTATGQGNVDAASTAVTTRHFAQFILSTARLSDRNVPGLRSEMPTELKLALAITTPDAKLLDLQIESLQLGLRMSAELFKDDEYALAWLGNRSRDDGDSELQRSRDSVELLRNKMVTPQIAADVNLVRARLRVAIGKELAALEQSFRTQVRAHLSRSPELAKSFTGANAVAPAVAESRVQLRRVLAQGEGGKGKQ